MLEDIKCKSLSDIFKRFKQIKSRFKFFQFIFRGEPEIYQYGNHYETLSPNEKMIIHNFPVPKLFRDFFNKGREQRKVWDESELYVKFLDQHRELDRKDPLDNLMLQRHYGMASRLLDWTRNLEVATFFAVREQMDSNVHNSAKDAVIYCYASTQLPDQMRLGRGLARFVAGFAACGDASVFCEYLLSAVEEVYVPPVFKIRKLNEQQIWPRFDPRVRQRLIELTSDSPAKFKKLELILGLLYEFPIIIDPPLIDKRIIAQHSLFTMHPGYIARGWQVMDFAQLPIGSMRIGDGNGSYENLLRLQLITIDGQMKAGIRRELENNGIHEASLFPGDIEKSVKFIEKNHSSNTFISKAPEHNEGSINGLLRDQGF